MGTLTSLLQVTTRALAADQAALSTTAENISNQNTEGYTRRSVAFTNGDTVSLRDMTASTGVSAAVTAQRDTVLQRSLLHATEAASSSSTRLSALNSLQSLFAINSSGDDAAGINAALSNFFSSANTLATTPTSTTARHTLFASAQTLATTLNQAAAQLSAQTSALNQTVSSSVDAVNGLLASVASLNGQIASAGPGMDTSRLQDQRDLALSHLAKLVDVNSVASSNGSVNLVLSDGTSLVSGSQVSALHTAMVNGSARVISGTTDVTGIIHGGSIGGAVQARDTDIPAVRTQLDALANAIVTQVNAQNAAGLDASGTPGGPIFAGSSAATITLAISSGDAVATNADGGNAAAMAELATGPIVNGSAPSTAFASLVAALGQTVADAGATSATDQAVLTQTTTQVAAVSSVSLDTEAANLTQYQRSYEAAAKILSIVNTLMAQAINLGSPTTVS